MFDKDLIKGKLLNIKDAYTFNDLILLPSYTEVEPKEVSLRTKVSVNHYINLPFVSAPMDTVTEADMAISLARLGGIGVLHRYTSIENQVEMAIKVKRAEALIIKDVITINANAKVVDAINLMKKFDIHGLPVVNDQNELLGIVTWRDVRYSDPNLYIAEVMTKRDRLIYAVEEIDLEEAKRLMQLHKIEKLPIVDKNWRLKGLITYRDLMLKDKYPLASRDEEGRLLVGAAVSPFDLRRATELSKYVDILVIDVAHFHNKNVIEATKKLIECVNADVIIGNLGTKEGVLDSVSRLENVAGLRVGLGSGSICKTGVVTRVAAPTLYAVFSAADALLELGTFGKIPIIADGGIKNSGDIALALAAGASAVMMGNILAGTKESPGRLVVSNGRYYKEYYGMGSSRARSKIQAFDRYFRPSKDIEEGVEGWVLYKGTVEDVVRELTAGLQAAFGYVGARNIEELWVKARFAKITPYGYQELQPHSIYMLKGVE